ncbi:MAG: hypothetical protein HYZ28_15265 [Myxococcales bacterium]|nr:hypothetical protein [Myxococcales bacterium]
MARDPKELQRLADELAALTPEERAKVIADASRRNRFRAPPRDWKPPVLTGGSHWDGGSLRREELYEDDGR